MIKKWPNRIILQNKKNYWKKGKKGGRQITLYNNEASESYIPDEPEEAIREFLKIVRKKLLEFKVDSI